MKKITIGIMAHVDAGKTTLSEAMLYETGQIKQKGRVDHGSAFLDDDPIERERGITIFSRQAHFFIGGDAKNDNKAESTEATLIDTPGHVDFSAEMERSLWVLDYALLVVSGSEGVQAHTKTLARMLRERGIPIFVFVNKMDIAIKSREELTTSLSKELAMPVVDFTDAAKRSEKFTDDVTFASHRLAEAALEDMLKPEGKGDDEGEAYLSDEQIARAISEMEIVPVLFGSALRGEGVRKLLKTMATFTEVPLYRDTFGARLYKTISAENGEKLAFIKVTGGTLKVRDKVAIKRAGASEVAKGGESKGQEREEKVNQIRLYQGGRYRMTDEVGAGTVCAVAGLGDVLPGDALGDETPNAGYSCEPFMVYSLIVPEGSDTHEVMRDMQTLSSEDPALAVSWSEDGNDILIRIMGEVQMEVLGRVIKERFGYEVCFDEGRVLYMETVTDTYEGIGHFEPLRHYAEVHLLIGPGERGSGISISSDVSEEELSLNWQRLIWTHLEEKNHRGVLTGSPLTDVNIVIAAGRAHLKHTVGGDFREATYRAVRNALMQACRDGNAVLLEPWCEYEIEMPSEAIGRVVNDIKQMGASQDSLEQREKTTVLKGKGPSAKIESYRRVLRSYASGEGKIQVTQCGYDEAVGAKDVIEKIGYDAERDVTNTADSVFVDHSGSDIVKWYEVSQRMHIPSVLKDTKRDEAETGTTYDKGSYKSEDVVSGMGVDAKEATRRRMAAEKDLQRIFEKTYGPIKPKRYAESKLISADGEGSWENEKADRGKKERNDEIKAHHQLRKKSGAADADERPSLLVIDGYNLIFADDELKMLGKRDIGSAKDTLIDRLANYAGYTGLDVKIVFDAYKIASGEGSTQKQNGVEVIHTAANELADVRIGRIARETAGRSVYVVSSDTLVQQDVLGKGAVRISSREFLSILSSTEEEIRIKL